MIQIHGFDWTVYAEHIMPAFEQWLVQRNEEGITRLFQATRCAREEALLPPALRRVRVWPRARLFVEMLPRGPYSRREYQKLCSADHFTAISDRYMYRHTPQLYQNPAPLRTIWGALIETYCLPWHKHAQDQEQKPIQETASAHAEFQENESAQVERGEVLALLRRVGLDRLAHEISEQTRTSTERLASEQTEPEPETQPLGAGRFSSQPDEIDFTGLAKNTSNEAEEGEEIEEYSRPMPGGIALGAHPNPWQLRGWLSGISPRAQALFEYLACGRRCLPFGYDPGEPYGVFVGYLTPDEVWRLGTGLRGVLDPDQAEAEADYLRFRYQHPGVPESSRLIDEVLPSHAAEFHRAVDMAAAQGLGLICSSE